jgi:hypothetical protein
MHIRMLHLPPEDFSAGGSSVGGSGVRTGGGKKDDGKGKGSKSSNTGTALQPGMGCASNKKGSANPLDF